MKYLTLARSIPLLIITAATVFMSASASYSATLYTFTGLAPAEGNRYSRAYSINNAGQIVGFSDNATGSASITLWSSGAPTVLGPLGPQASGFDINDQGQVVTMQGNAALINTLTGVTETLNGVGLYSSARGINNNGFVVGYDSTAAGNDRAFLWNPQAGNGPQAVQDLGSIGGRATYGNQPQRPCL